jgi:hypothetical protein
MKMLLLLALLLTLDACQNPSRLQAVQSARPQTASFPEGMSLIGGTFETPPDVRYTAAFGGGKQTLSEHRPRAEFDP